MRRSFTALALPLLAAAAPVKRAANATDLLVLNFAFVLEQLETQFYTEGLQKFSTKDFADAGFSSGEVAVEQLQTILGDESTHTSVLHQTILDQGGQPITNCKFDFSSALTDLPTMAATARVVEMVGVGAYLGAASLVTDPQLLTAAASILTVEARHSSMLNILSGTGTAVPAAFDLPLSPPQVLAIAGGFISGCDVGVKGNAPLKVTNTDTIAPGTTLTFDLAGMDPSGLSCQMLLGGQAQALSFPVSECKVPEINGPVAVFITNTDQPLVNSQLVQFAASIVMGPTLTFIDTQPQTIGQLVHNTGAAINSSSLITPGEASSVQAEGSATASAEGSQSTSESGSGGEASATSSASGSESTGSATQSGSESVSGSEASATSSASQAQESGSANEGTNNVGANPTDNEQSRGGANFVTGPSPDGHTVVEGWQNLPPSA